MTPPVSHLTRIFAAIVLSAVSVSSMATPAWTAPRAIPQRGSPPIITSFSPRNGPVGTNVTIDGNNFTGATSVTFDGHGAQFSVVNDERVTTVVPSGATTGKVAVGTPSGSDSSFGDFTVTGNAPGITNFQPRSGPVGTAVAIDGNNFTGATSVMFNGHTAQFSVVNDTRITTSVPSGATTGLIRVTTPSGFDVSGGAFTVTGNGPAITNFQPRNGPVGTAVTIDGDRFTGATSVMFNGQAAQFSVVNDARITTTVPSGATTGLIRVTTPSGFDVSGGPFTVTGGAPVITNFSPRSGPVGTAVTIDGDRFTGATSVTFNGQAAQFSVVNDARITATVPSGATTGLIRVTTPSGFDVSEGAFTVTGGTHERSVSLFLGGRLLAYGRVVSLDGFDACEGNVPVVIKRFHRGRWHWLATTATEKDGSYRALVRDRRGRYRARAKRVVLVDGSVCLGDRSAPAFNR